MEIHRAARRHRLTDEDIEHAVTNATTWAELGEDPRRYLVVGPDRSGNLLELMVLHTVEQNRAGGPRDGASTQHRTRAVWKGAVVSGRTYGHTETGKPITDETIDELAAEAERDYQPGELRGRRRGPGRPPLGTEAKSVESVRLEPALRAAAAQRADDEGVTVSEVIRRALRKYLHSA